jgi:carbamoyltransferase
MTFILGLTTVHDAAATLVHDGEVVAAVAEERLSGRKHHIGFPFQAVDYCLREAGIGIDAVDHVSLYWKPWLVGRKALQTAASAVHSPALFAARARRGVHQGDTYRRMLRYPALIRDRFGPSDFRFHYLEHHRCHAASAFLVSPFERAAILTLDGAGESTTTMLSTGSGAEITTLERIRLPHSLGQFYSAITNFLGFDMAAGDEWKVMGLAAYGEPVYEDFLSRRVLSRQGGGRFRLRYQALDHHLAKSYRFSREAIQGLGPPRRPGEELTKRHENIAASAQRVLEETVLELVHSLHERTGETNLCLAGGTALNSVLNGRIIEESPFENVFIQPAAADDGCSLGAAFLTHHEVLGHPRCFTMEHPYFGPSFSGEECGAALDEAGLEHEVLADDELLPRVARLLADGAVVGWFQGRAEFGPRALGNRSFLVSPCLPESRERLRDRAKVREWFRPLAPSVLEEASAELFGKPYRDPFMVTAVHVVPEAHERIPAAIHVDGTARPQTVRRDLNPRYWRLIDEFRQLTGVPVLVNTSFNLSGDTMVCSPKDAIRSFQRASFDALVLEDRLVMRQ